MPLSYTAPARLAWARMLRMLFQPFRFETWAVLGFAAFLSEYLSSPGGGRSGLNLDRMRSGTGTGPGIGVGAILRGIADFLLHPVWGPLALGIALAALTFFLFVMWVNCRGKFIFLDNVVHERAGIVEPWKRFAAQGNSLFGFKLVATLAVAALVVGISLPLLPAILAAISEGAHWRVWLGVFALWWIAAMMPLLLVIAVASLFLDQFVVPIMYRDGLGVLAAWRRFLSLLRAHLVPLVGFALLYLVAIVAVAAGIVAVGFATCCVGFVLVTLPYVGSVVTLPIEVTMRGIGPEFLAQFGPEWSVFAAKSGAPPAAGTGA